MEVLIGPSYAVFLVEVIGISGFAALAVAYLASQINILYLQFTELHVIVK